MEDHKSDKDVRKLFGPSLKNVKDGEHILSYIEKLVAERDALEERQKHLTSLTHLFEKTVYDADDLAAQIIKDAEDLAQEKAGIILSQADEKIVQFMDEKKLEAVKIAEIEAQAMKEGFERELELKLLEKKTALQKLVRDYSERIYGGMMTQLENFKQQTALLEIDIEDSISSQNILTAQAITVVEVSDNDDTDIQTTLEITGENDVLHDVPPNEIEIHEVSPDESVSGPKLLELEILPPRDKDAMEEIRTYLADLEGVASVDLRHLTDKTIIEIVLHGNIDIIESLTELSQIEQIQEVEVGGQKKIQIFLSVRSELEKEKDRLNFKANHIASR